MAEYHIYSGIISSWIRLSSDCSMYIPSGRTSNSTPVNSGNVTPERLNLSHSEIDFKSEKISGTSDKHYCCYNSAVDVFITDSESLTVEDNTTARNINATSFGRLVVKRDIDILFSCVA